MGLREGRSPPTDTLVDIIHFLENDILHFLEFLAFVA